ncbi:hypothetical protein [Komagataeibacter sp. SM21]|uniref:hypothetical protein n=1 Tax=Komagataeibacter sp. SM21 TaxID=3242899 RepID=UPI003528C75F
MRTREEQIKVLAADFADPPESYQMMEVAELHILEAERRAEQRVRAEIARDSERLDWLEDIVDTGFRVSPIGRGISGASFNHGYGGISAATLRSAIDAAREAQG